MVGCCTFVSLKNASVKETGVHHCPLTFFVHPLACRTVQRLQLDGAKAMEVALTVSQVALDQNLEISKSFLVFHWVSTLCCLCWRVETVCVRLVGYVQDKALHVFDEHLWVARVLLHSYDSLFHIH
jgi:hypothetical protein